MTGTTQRNNAHNLPYGMGWLPDLPDFRDYGMDNDKVSEKLKQLGQNMSVKEMLTEAGLDKGPEATLPASADLRQWCTKIENQGKLGSCTANAGVGLIEYYIKKVYGTETDASRLFLYKVTRILLGWEGDTGAFLRSTMAAMRLFGTPPERYWPYVEEKFDEQPPSYCYALAKEFQAVQYFRLDKPTVTTEKLLKNIKALLAAGMPTMFGFTVYNSIWSAKDGKIPYPSPNDNSDGGHAIVAVGYDDDMEIAHPTYMQDSPDGSGERVPFTTKGALLIRNSWGESWGEEGYGWLPYKYVLDGLAVDWWCLLKNEWVNANVFGLPMVND